jgi:hypothetical protein
MPVPARLLRLHRTNPPKQAPAHDLASAAAATAHATLTAGAPAYKLVTRFAFSPQPGMPGPYPGQEFTVSEMTPYAVIDLSR